MGDSERDGERTVRLRVRYLSAVRDRTGMREESVELPQGSRLRELAAWLARERGLKLPDPLVMATLNGKGWFQYPEGLDAEIREADEVALFPIVMGG